MQPAPNKGTSALDEKRPEFGFSWLSLINGAMCSAIIGLAFMNLQAISDAAPEFIKNSSLPGLFGVPIAVISVLWLIAIPGLLVRSVIKGAMRGNGFSLPSPFIIGAFLVLFAGMMAVKATGAF